MQKAFESRANRPRVKNISREVRAVIYPRNHRVEIFIAHALKINFYAISWRAVESPGLAVGIVKAFVLNLAHKS